MWCLDCHNIKYTRGVAVAPNKQSAVVAFSSQSQSGKMFLQTDKNGKDFEGSRPNLILLTS